RQAVRKAPWAWGPGPGGRGGSLRPGEAAEDRRQGGAGAGVGELDLAREPAADREASLPAAVGRIGPGDDRQLAARLWAAGDSLDRVRRAARPAPGRAQSARAGPD